MSNLSKGRIVAVFSCSGKTHYVLNNFFRVSCIDLDMYDWARSIGGGSLWIDPYIARAEQLQSKFDFVFVNALPIILERIESKSLVVHPHSSLKDEWIERAKRRNPESAFFSIMDKCWDKWIDACEQWKGSNFILAKGEYLSDVEACGQLKPWYTLTTN